MARPSNTEERRAQIVEALGREMATGGYEGATIAKIAASAGLRPGLIHYHFQNKLDILLALVERLVAGVRARFEALRAKHGRDEEGGPRRELEALLDAYLARGPGADPHAVRAWVALGTEALRQAEVGAVYGKALEEQTAFFEALVRGVLREEGRELRGAREIAVGITAAIEGTYRIAAAAPELAPEGFAARTVRRMTEGMLAAQPLVQRAPKR